MNTEKLLKAAETLHSINNFNFRIIDNSNQLYFASDTIYKPTGLHFLTQEQVKRLSKSFQDEMELLKSECLEIIKNEVL